MVPRAVPLRFAKEIIAQFLFLQFTDAFLCPTPIRMQMETESGNII
jgi:hypothetical protein